MGDDPVDQPETNPVAVLEGRLAPLLENVDLVVGNVGAIVSSLEDRRRALSDDRDTNRRLASGVFEHWRKKATNSIGVQNQYRVMLYAAHLIALVGVALISLLAAWWVHQQSQDRTGTAMIVLLVGHGTVALLTAIQLLGSTVTWQAFWYRLAFLVSLVLPIVWFVLAVYYTGREHWLTKPIWGAILASPVVPILIWATDPVFGLAIVDSTFQTEPFELFVPQFTTGWFVLFGLLGMYPLFAFGLFVHMLIFPRRRSRWKAGVVVVGIIAIWITSGIAETSLAPVPGFPYVHYGNGIFGVFVAVALFRTQLFDVTPLAHETIFDSIDDAIVVVDASRRISDFNEPASDLFPDLEDRIGDTLDNAYPALVAQKDESCADGGGATAIVEQVDGTLDAPFAGTIRISRADNSRTIRISASEITNAGEPRGYALIMRDVTELERYAVDLEHKTDQLERFASVLSHDLRNPISIANGYADLARETGDLDHLEDVEIALERMEETIDDLLTLSREGESIDETTFVALRSLVDDAWTTSDTRELRFENEVAPDYRIRADPSRVKTMLENLFRNVADHGGETVWVEPLETGTGFAISDDGPGIPEEDRDQIFEYGYSSTPEGTGLGLSIVSSIVTAHGWSLSVTQSENGGARFEISTVERAYTGEDDVTEFDEDMASTHTNSNATVESTAPDEDAADSARFSFK
ncbi:hypothetical protein B2G88_04965 [Natronolimnobius baerhuensis]|uniref:histidine kinase n=1 Tax=Natronolimnobius baerhuensis TaxID=253108 RepID=A0A202ED29_9EURY|nr:hypothetical protein B2G88_04965 [Natronolimnobius baerhuensis]